MSTNTDRSNARRVISRIPHRSGRPTRIPMIPKVDFTFDTRSRLIANDPVSRKIQPSHNCIAAPSSKLTSSNFKRRLSEITRVTETSNKRRAKRRKTNNQHADRQSISDSLSDPVKWYDFKNELDATMDSADFSEAALDHSSTMDTTDLSEATFDHSSTDLFSQHQSLFLESPPAGIHMFQEACSPVLKRCRSLSIDEGFELPPTKRNRHEDDGDQMFSIYRSISKPGINRLRRPVLHTPQCGSKAKGNPYEQQTTILEKPEINVSAGFFRPACDSAYASSNQTTSSHSLSSSPVFESVGDSIDPALKILTPSVARTYATPPTDTPTQPSACSSHHSYKNTCDHDLCSCHQIMGRLLEEIHSHYERLTGVLAHFKK